MQILRLKTILILLSLTILGGCIREVRVLAEPSPLLLRVPPPPEVPELVVTEDIFETARIYREDSRLVRSQLQAISDWFTDMRDTAREN